MHYFFQLDRLELYDQIIFSLWSEFIIGCSLCGNSLQRLYHCYAYMYIDAWSCIYMISSRWETCICSIYCKQKIERCAFCAYMLCRSSLWWGRLVLILYVNAGFSRFNACICTWYRSVQKSINAYAVIQVKVLLLLSFKQKKSILSWYRQFLCWTLFFSL